MSGCNNSSLSRTELTLSNEAKWSRSVLCYIEFHIVVTYCETKCFLLMSHLSILLYFSLLKFANSNSTFELNIVNLHFVTSRFLHTQNMHTTYN